MVALGEKVESELQESAEATDVAPGRGPHSRGREEIGLCPPADVCKSVNAQSPLDETDNDSRESESNRATE